MHFVYATRCATFPISQFPSAITILSPQYSTFEDPYVLKSAEISSLASPGYLPSTIQKNLDELFGIAWKDSLFLNLAALLAYLLPLNLRTSIILQTEQIFPVESLPQLEHLLALPIF